VIDTREQLPLDLSPLTITKKALKTGDYSLLGYETEVAFERKSLGDFIMCCTFERERFEREIERLTVFKYKAIFIESNWSTIALKQYRGQTNPNAALSSAAGFAMSANVSIVMSDSHSMTGRLVRHWLQVAYRRILRNQSTSKDLLPDTSELNIPIAK
jgi:ERCC4-type nuclease